MISELKEPESGFAALLADIREQQALEAAAKVAHEANIKGHIDAAWEKAQPLYRKLANEVASATKRPQYRDAVVLLGAMRALIVRYRAAANDERFTYAVDSIENSLLEFSQALADECDWHQGEPEYTHEQEMVDDDRRKGVDE